MTSCWFQRWWRWRWRLSALNTRTALFSHRLINFRCTYAWYSVFRMCRITQFVLPEKERLKISNTKNIIHRSTVNTQQQPQIWLWSSANRISKYIRESIDIWPDWITQIKTAFASAISSSALEKYGNWLMALKSPQIFSQLAQVCLSTKNVFSRIVQKNVSIQCVCSAKWPRIHCSSELRYGIGQANPELRSNFCAIFRPNPVLGYFIEKSEEKKLVPKNKIKFGEGIRNLKKGPCKSDSASKTP